ncbi:unnamed protein product [Cuscuta epithymum]|uniref:C2H2-type domain-containing protein n=1 Tax=Cuscuta epithymum TaxID=186058 RepID=A0AAV0F8W7_9ASTE|nr:unnamed protein product [Cuscuta epithymum]
MMSGDVFSIPSCLKPTIHPPPQEPNPNPKPNPPSKKRRNLPGTPDPDAEVIALSPKTLMATNRFVCEICNKGFQRDQNLQLHRRGHNLPWKLKQRAKTELVKRKVYICPEKSCVHHDASRALGDLTGIKKHFSRKHGEKKWKCEKCSKKYAVQSDWKAHSKTCGTREYKCDCGTLFSRKDSFITHRAFCDALAEESARITSVAATTLSFRNNEALLSQHHQSNLPHGFSSGAGIPQIPAGFQPDFQQKPRLSLWLDQAGANNTTTNNSNHPHHHHLSSPIHQMQAANSGNLFGSNSSTGLPDMLHGHIDGSPLIYGQSSPSIENFATGSLSLSTLPAHDNEAAAAAVAEGGMMILNKVSATSSSMAETLNSMYTHENHHSLAPMSATALLLKAAQIGSTKSNPTLYGNGFGLMNSSSSSSNNLRGFAKDSHNNNFNSPGNDNGGVEHSSYFGQSHHGVSMNGVNSSHLTRDFLGMGNEGGRPFFAEELVKFASSMGSAGGMGLSHFGSDDDDHHH